MGKQRLKQEIKNITSQLIKKYKPEKIILFGSAARGETSRGSDLDFLIVKKGTDNLRGHERHYQLRKMLPLLDIAVDFLIYSPYEIKKRLHLGDPFIEQVFKEGQILYGT